MDPVRLVERLQASDPDAATAGELAGMFHTLRQLTGWASSVEARLAQRASALESRGEGAPAAEAISRGTRTSARSAKRTERRGAALAAAPAVAKQLEAGRISTEHADKLAAEAERLDEQQRSALFGHDRDLASRAAAQTPAQFARTVRRVVDGVVGDDGTARSERQRKAATLPHGVDEGTGMGWMRADLHPDDYQRVARRLDAEIAALRAGPGNDGARYDQLAAEAAVTLITGARAASTPPAEVVVLIDLDTLVDGAHDRTTCEYGDGTPVPLATARRHACDANIIPAVLDSASMPLDVGRGARQATSAQRRALRAMYRTCAIDGCECSFERCEMHHLLEWDRHRGPTDLDNMVPLCAFHHHRAHEGRWRLQLDPSTRQLTVILPSGEPHSCAVPDVLAERTAA